MGAKTFYKSGSAHACAFEAFELVEGQVGNINVEDDAGWEGVFCVFLYDCMGDMSGGFPVRILIGAEGDGDAGYAENHGFAGGGYCARVEDADAGVGTEIYAADDEVG